MGLAEPVRIRRILLPSFRQGAGKEERVMMGENLLRNYLEVSAVIIFCVGLSTMLFHQNLIKKIIGFNIMDTSVFLFLAAEGYISGRRAPILSEGQGSGIEMYVNPIPSALVLTGIVVSVSVTAVALALALRLYEQYKTLNMDEIFILRRGENL
jgi:multicomponent Na+:H+ antiporter subunit C